MLASSDSHLLNAFYKVVHIIPSLFIYSLTVVFIVVFEHVLHKFKLNWGQDVLEMVEITECEI